MSTQRGTPPVAIDKGPRPGAAVQLKPDGSGELVYKVTVKNLDAVNKATTKPIMDVVRVPAEVKVTGPVTVNTTNTGASATGAVSSIPASSFVAGQTVKLADSLSIDPGKQFVFELRVPIKVDPKLDQAKWDALAKCTTVPNQPYAGGVPNGVTLEGDSDGPANNEACIPVKKPKDPALVITKVRYDGNDGITNDTLSGAAFAIHKALPDGSMDPNPFKSDLPVDSTGSVKTGLPAGDYYLIETRAPESGYNLLAAPVPFTIEPNGDSYRLRLTGRGDSNVVSTDNQDKLTVELTVADTTIGKLPKTGGWGAWPYALAAMGLSLAGLALGRRNKEARG